MPIFPGPVGALANADEVEERPGPQRVMHDMAAGADPIGADLARDRRRQTLHLDHAAPGDDAAELRLGGSEQRRAHQRMDAVGADRELGPDRRSRRETQFDVAVARRNRDAPAIEVYRTGLFPAQRSGDDPVQIAAVDGDVGKAVAFDRHHAEIEKFPALPGIP